MKYDIAIVGTGPAGMFCALELIKLNPGLKIAMFEKGTERPAGETKELTCGWGGAGAFSDGKLTFSPRVGGVLAEVLSKAVFEELSSYCDHLYIRFGGEGDKLYGDDDAAFADFQRKAATAYLEVVPQRVRHLGTDTNRVIVMNIREHLLQNGVTIFLQKGIDRIARGAEGFMLFDERGESYVAERVLVCPGRLGEDWWRKEAQRLGLKVGVTGVDVGVRVEVPNGVMKHLTDVLYEAKILYTSRKYGDKVRTFCMCPGGFIAIEHYHGIMVANGHSAKHVKSPNCNFAVLVTQEFTEPFNDPHGYASHISELGNMLGKTLLVQRLGDIRYGRRTNTERLRDNAVQPALEPGTAMPTAGDIALMMPHRHMVDIIEFLDALDHLAPGVAASSTLLYAPEVKYYSSRVEVRDGFETAIPGLYVGGDGSGYTRGLIQSSMMGVAVARHMCSK